MSRIAAAFAKGKAFIPFVMAGDPDLARTMETLHALARAGADVIEVGVPFSDPVADGPVIQRAAERALARGTRLADVLGALAAFRLESQVPLVLFAYLNPLLAWHARAADGGAALRAAADAILLVDLPLEEEADVVPAGVERIFLAAPSTSESRLRGLAAARTPFVYYVSRYGVTGAQDEVPPDLAANVRRARELTGKPVAVGFGISTPEQARAVARVADGVVVGSALVAEIERAPAGVFAFAKALADAVHQA